MLFEPISVSKSGRPIKVIIFAENIPDSKVLGANMGPIWGRKDPGGPNVGPMNLAIWDNQVGLTGNRLMKITTISRQSENDKNDA